MMFYVYVGLDLLVLSIRGLRLRVHDRCDMVNRRCNVV